MHWDNASEQHLQDDTNRGCSRRGFLPGAQPGGLGYYNYLRKPASDFGWDWGPAFTPSGIYGGVQVQAYSAAILTGARCATCLHAAASPALCSASTTAEETGKSSWRYCCMFRGIFEARAGAAVARAQSKKGLSHWCSLFGGISLASPEHAARLQSPLHPPQSLMDSRDNPPSRTFTLQTLQL